MVSVKGLSESVANLIGTYVKLRSDSSDPQSILTQLSQDPLLSQNSCAMEGVTQLQLLFKYLEFLGVQKMKVVVFDLSLARGLDYYTGVIYEAVLNQSELERPGIQSFTLSFVVSLPFLSPTDYIHSIFLFSTPF